MLQTLCELTSNNKTPLEGTNKRCSATPNMKLRKEHQEVMGGDKTGEIIIHYCTRKNIQ